MYRTNSGSVARRRARGRRAGFTLRDLVACIVCMSMLGWLGCMWLNNARVPATRNACLSNIRQLALATLNHESTLKRFPLVSDATAPLHEIPPGTLGSDATNSAGYSWLVKLLP